MLGQKCEPNFHLLLMSSGNFPMSDGSISLSAISWCQQIPFNSAFTVDKIDNFPVGGRQF
jgi:hypothetical protein